MRSAPRNLTSASATVFAEDGGALGSVAVLDVSTGGARLAVPSDRVLPARFRIVLPNQPPRLCEVRWRLTHALGVRFVDRAPLRSAPTTGRIQELEAAVVRLERENAVLAQELSLHRAFQFEHPRSVAPKPMESRRAPPAREPRIVPSARFLGTFRARAEGA